MVNYQRIKTLTLGWLLVILPVLALAQDSTRRQFYAREFSVITENDAYLFHKHDAYYTNGIFLRLNWAGEKNGRKTVHAAELGQMIYTPLIRKTQSTNDIDRPYCGYLFARYARNKFSPEDALFQYSLTLGVVGNLSLGESMQNSYHRLFDYSRFTGWQYQVQNAVGMDIGLLYARTLWQNNLGKIVPAAQLSLGTNYTNARLGNYFCLGATEKNSNSALWNARVQTREPALRRKSEFFVYWYPEIILQGYNATVQGGLFSKGQGAVLAQPERWMFQQTVGVCYAETRWTIKAGVCFQDKEALSQKTAQQYGSLQLSYRFP
jgi:lipid A 3-O-deacylase